MLAAFFSATYASSFPSRTCLSTHRSCWSRMPSKRMSGTP